MGQSTSTATLRNEVTGTINEPDPKSGKTVAVWELYEKLGEGGFGAVHRAMRKKDRMEAAIKTIKHETAAECQNSFKELHLLQKLDHPAIMKVFKGFVLSGSEGKTLVIVMEYLDGQTLGDLMKELRAVPLILAIGWFLQLVDAFSYLASQGVLHRDVKPQNIMVVPAKNAEGEKTGEVKLKVIDFGLATQMVSQYKGGGKTIAGTPAWMAPEVMMENLRPSNGKYDSSVDMWGLGCILFEVVSGVQFWKGAGGMIGELAVPNNNYLETHIQSAVIHDLLVAMLKIQPSERIKFDQLKRHPVLEAWAILFAGQKPDPKRSAIGALQLQAFCNAISWGEAALASLALDHLLFWAKANSKAMKPILGPSFPCVIDQTVKRHFDAKAALQALNDAAGNEGLLAALKVALLEDNKALKMLSELLKSRKYAAVAARKLVFQGFLPKLSTNLLNPEWFDVFRYLLTTPAYTSYLDYGFDYRIVDILKNDYDEKKIKSAYLRLVTMPAYNVDHTEVTDAFFGKLDTTFNVTKDAAGILVTWLASMAEPFRMITTQNAPTWKSHMTRLLNASDVEIGPATLNFGSEIVRMFCDPTPHLQYASWGSCTEAVFGQIPMFQMLGRIKPAKEGEQSRWACLACTRNCSPHRIRKVFSDFHMQKGVCGCDPNTCKSRGKGAPITYDVNTPIARPATLPAPFPPDFNTTRYLAHSGMMHLEQPELKRYEYVWCQGPGFVHNATDRQHPNPTEVLFYFEITAVELSQTYSYALDPGILAVGLAPKADKHIMDHFVGHHRTEVAVHGDDGNVYALDRQTDGARRLVARYMPRFYNGDVIGMGVTRTGAVFGTFNGLFMGLIQNARVESSVPLFVTVSSYGSCKVKLTTSAPFVFNPPTVLPAPWPHCENDAALTALFDLFPKIASNLDVLGHDLSALLHLAVESPNYQRAASILPRETWSVIMKAIRDDSYRIHPVIKSRLAHVLAVCGAGGNEGRVLPLFVRHRQAAANLQQSAAVGGSSGGGYLPGGMMPSRVAAAAPEYPGYHQPFMPGAPTGSTAMPIGLTPARSMAGEAAAPAPAPAPLARPPPVYEAPGMPSAYEPSAYAPFVPSAAPTASVVNSTTTSTVSTSASTAPSSAVSTNVTATTASSGSEGFSDVLSPMLLPEPSMTGAEDYYYTKSPGLFGSLSFGLPVPDPVDTGDNQVRPAPAPAQANNLDSLSVAFGLKPSVNNSTRAAPPAAAAAPAPSQALLPPVADIPTAQSQFSSPPDIHAIMRMQDEKIQAMKDRSRRGN